MISSKTLAKLISSLDREHNNPEKTIGIFLAYVKRKNLGYKLPNVLKHLERRAENRKDSFVALTVSHEISAETEKQIRQFIGVGEKMPVETKVDPKILGGFVAEYNNMVYDGSLDRQLKRLKDVLLEN